MSLLENTSKFGTGPVTQDDFDGRMVEPISGHGHVSKRHHQKRQMLEGSLNLPLQSSSNSGTAFLDLMLINSSKLEPTDS